MKHKNYIYYFPSSKFYILAPNYKDNQSLYLYNKEKRFHFIYNPMKK